jgi:hypothetical protein
MKYWTTFKLAFKDWVKRNIIDDAPSHLEDEFSEKYRK